jgi:hypothetical protein
MRTNGRLCSMPAPEHTRQVTSTVITCLAGRKAASSTSAAITRRCSATFVLPIVVPRWQLQKPTSRNAQPHMVQTCTPLTPSYFSVGVWLGGAGAVEKWQRALLLRGQIPLAPRRRWCGHRQPPSHPLSRSRALSTAPALLIDISTAGCASGRPCCDTGDQDPSLGAGGGRASLLRIPHVDSPRPSSRGVLSGMWKVLYSEYTHGCLPRLGWARGYAGKGSGHREQGMGYGAGRKGVRPCSAWRRGGCA